MKFLIDIVTLDHDFVTLARSSAAAPPIIHVRIHPPYAPDLIAAFTRFLDGLSGRTPTGLTVLQKTGTLRFWE